MKRLLLLVLLCVSAVSASLAQSTTPFKGANVIVVQTPDSASVALNQLARVFVAQGFNISKLDQGLAYLATEGQPRGQVSPATFSYRATVTPTATGSELKITGVFAVQVGLRSVSESMAWSKSKLWQGRLCFDAAQQVAMAYPKGIVSYSTGR